MNEVAFPQFLTDVDQFVRTFRSVIDDELMNRSQEYYSDMSFGSAVGLARIESIKLVLRLARSRLRHDPIAHSNDHFDQLKTQIYTFIEDFREQYSDNNPIQIRRSQILLLHSKQVGSEFLREIVRRSRPIDVLDLLDLFGLYLSETTLAHSDLGTSLERPSHVPQFSQETTRRLRKILPKQQIAPAQFEVRENKIRIVNKNAKAAKQDASNIASALQHLKGVGKNLIEGLENSNCDKRLLSSVKDLHGQLDSEENIVKLGMSNLASATMCDQFRFELPDAILATFVSYTNGIAQYLAQFPDWQRFTQNAAENDLQNVDLTQLNVGVDSILSAIETSPELSSPEVPRTIQLVKEFFNNPKQSTKRGAYALIKTIENLVSAICSFASDIILKTAQKLADNLSTVSSGIIVGMLTIAVAGGTGVGVAATAAGIPWLQQAGELAQGLLGQIAQKQ
jgi:hypothetical protein